MTLVIENGTGVASADSFITVAEYDALYEALFVHNGQGSTAQKEAALRRSWYYMKSLSWKSDYPFPTLGGTIPADVKTAQAVFAHYELDNVNGLAPSVVAGQQKTLIKAGEIGWQANGISGVDAQRANVTMAMDLLKPYINARTIFLDRA
jgi:hypothetical protein